MKLADLLLRIRALFQRNRVEQELDEELQFHLEMAARKHGSEARRRFGSVDGVKEECRNVRGTQLIETSFRDIRYALRGFRRNPLFVLTVVGTIALGLGLNTALFTMFSTYVLRPFAVRDAYSLYSFTWTNRAGDGHEFSPREFENFRATNSAFSEVLATEYFYGRMEGRGTAGLFVTGNYFRMLDGATQLGRPLRPEDAAAPGREPVIVLSHSTWQNNFGGDAQIIGKKVAVGGYPLEVVGVAQESFQGLESAPPSFWIPWTMARQLADAPGHVRVVGRLRPGWSVTQAGAGLNAWSKQATADLPAADRAVGVLLRSEATAVRLSRGVLLMFTPLMAAFGLVLLLACANVANMMLARAMSRQREIGVRLSLGAARPRLIRQLLTESVLLAVPAGLAGFFVSRAAIDLGLRLMYATIPSDYLELIPGISLPPDSRVFGFMLVAALLSAVLFGLAPAIQATRANVMQVARGEFTSDIRPMRLRNTLMIGQITICAFLLVCSGVCIRGARAMEAFDPGVKTRGAMFAQLSEKNRPQALRRLAAERAVESIAAVSSVPLDGLAPSLTISVAGRGITLRAWHNHVSHEFFHVLDVRLLAGRTFTAAEEKESAPVVILSELAARTLWPKGSAVGREIEIRREPEDNWGEALPKYSKVRVVGVARNIITCSVPYGPDPSLVYFPTAVDGHTALVARVNGDVETVRRKVASDLDATFPGALQQIHPMDQAFAGNVYPFRVASWVGLALGGLALLLTLSGIYGVLSYLITQRTKEIGIRMALGATSGAVARLVLRQSGRLALIGICIGAAMALGVSRLMASHLVFINTFDALAYGGGIVLVAVSALAAAYIPSRRAARIDPGTTLRYD